MILILMKIDKVKKLLVFKGYFQNFVNIACSLKHLLEIFNLGACCKTWSWSPTYSTRTCSSTSSCTGSRNSKCSRRNSNRKCISESRRNWIGTWGYWTFCNSPLWLPGCGRRWNLIWSWWYYHAYRNGNLKSCNWLNNLYYRPFNFVTDWWRLVERLM